MTYSIIGRDPQTGEIGIAVQSRYFAAGRIVPWLAAGVGGIASQAFVSPAYGHKGLDLLSKGMAPTEVIAKLTAEDEDAAIRQVGILDASGRAAAHTGARCFEHAGHAMGGNCVAQANMCAGDVWNDMIRAYETSTGTLAERLLAALRAAESAGGDIRGSQAAGLVIVAAQTSGVPALDRVVDLRVDDHHDPVGELFRHYTYARALAEADRSEELAMSGNFSGALELLDRLVKENPGDPEFLSRRALVLAALGRIEDARSDVRAAIDYAPGWREFLLELVDKQFVPMEREQILALLP